MELQQQITNGIERNAGSVVRVEARRRSASSGIVWSADGVIVTANHTVEWDEDVRVGLPEGGTVPAAIAGRDPSTDVAVLRVAAENLAPPAWREPEDLRVGHLALALSRPGRSARASLGIVSAFGEGWRTPAGGRVDRYVQTDIALHRGFSGGPLLGLDGRAIGMNTAGLLREHAVAVPAPTLTRVVATLLAHGRVRRGFLGVASMPVQLPPQLSSLAGQPSALLLVSVEPGSPAEQAGLLLGDALVSVDGAGVRHPGDLLPFVEEDRIGSTLAVRLIRAGNPLDASLVVGERTPRGGDES